MNRDLKIEAAQLDNIKVNRVLVLNLLNLDLSQLARNLSAFIGVGLDILRSLNLIVTVLTV